MWNTYCVQSYIEESFSATSMKHMQDHFLGFLGVFEVSADSCSDYSFA